MNHPAIVQKFTEIGIEKIDSWSLLYFEHNVHYCVILSSVFDTLFVHQKLCTVSVHGLYPATFVTVYFWKSPFEEREEIQDSG